MSRLKVGAATLDITPPPGLPMGGYGGRSGNAVGVAERLFARALTFFDEANNRRLALVVADLVAFDPSTVDEFGKRVEQIAGIHADDVILAVTHTHSGPAYGKLFAMFDRSGAREESQQSREWGRELPAALAETLRRAMEGEKLARIGETVISVGLSTNRRYRDPSGEVRLAPNWSGEVDPSVKVLQARALEDGETIATLVNYACHPVVLCEDNLLYSGDYPAYLIQAIEAETGGPAIFVNGACGDINPKWRGSQKAARHLGSELARAVCGALEGMHFEEEASVEVVSSTVALPLAFPSEQALQSYVSDTEQALAAHDDPENFEGRRLQDEVSRARQMAERLALRRRRLEGLMDAHGRVRARIHAARVASTLLVALPGEVFNGLGRQLQSSVTNPPSFVLGYCGKSIGYVPAREAYREGGYEVSSSYLATGAGEMLIDEAAKLLERLGRSDATEGRA